MRAVVVIPTFNGRRLLAQALESLNAQSVPVEIVVVDNGSTDGTLEALADRFPRVAVVRNTRNVGFGRAINRGVKEAAVAADVIVLVNNDTICAPDFIECLLRPFADPKVGMVAGVLLQGSAHHLIDSAGIELDITLRSWDMLWNQPVRDLALAAEPVGPCGGAAAYRADAFVELGGFDEQLFAYWEDVDLALRFRLAGWGCVRAPGARAIHHHGATLGAASPAQRRLDAFGRGYLLAKYRVSRCGIGTRIRIAILDWPGLLVHLVARREVAPVRSRFRGIRAALRREAVRAPLELATVGLAEALGRQYRVPWLRLTGRLPAHFGHPDLGRDGGTQGTSSTQD